MLAFPNVVISEIALVREGVREPLSELILVGIMFAIICFVVLLTQGTRKIPVQYAKRVVGRKVYGGQNTHIPMKVNTAGVMPIIFAQSIMFIPSTVSTFLGDSKFGDFNELVFIRTLLFIGYFWFDDYFFTYFILLLLLTLFKFHQL